LIRGENTIKIVSAESNKILSIEVYVLEEGRQTGKVGWAVGIIISKRRILGHLWINRLWKNNYS